MTDLYRKKEFQSITLSLWGACSKNFINLNRFQGFLMRPRGSKQGGCFRQCVESGGTI